MPDKKDDTGALIAGLGLAIDAVIEAVTARDPSLADEIHRQLQDRIDTCSPYPESPSRAAVLPLFQLQRLLEKRRGR